MVLPNSEETLWSLQNEYEMFKQWQVSLWHNSASILSRLRKTNVKLDISILKNEVWNVCVVKRNLVQIIILNLNELAFSRFCAWITNHYVPESCSDILLSWYLSFFVIVFKVGFVKIRNNWSGYYGKQRGWSCRLGSN